MKKIAIITNSTNGLYSFRKELVESLVQSELSVWIIAPISSRSAYFRELGCEIVEIQMENRGTNPIKDLALFLKYDRIMRNIKPDVVFTYTVKPNTYAGFLCGIKKIPYLVNITGLGEAIEHKGLLAKIVLTLYRLGLKKARWVFFQNASNQELFRQKKLVSEKCSVLPGSGVNLSYHTFQEYPKETENIRFLFIGRMLKDKGMDELLEVIPQIKEQFPQVTFTFVGEVTELYATKIAKMERQKLLVSVGQQPEVRGFIKESHATILPSYHEGTANVLLESAAAGRPVLASKVPGCQETFEEGITGIGFQSKDTSDLKRAILAFLELSYEQKKEMGRAARKKMEAEYDRQIVVKAYIEKLKELE